MFENAADEKLVRDERKKIENERDQELEDLKNIIKTNEGKRFFTRFFREGKLADISMTGNSWTFFNEGHRNFAKIIYSDVAEADPQAAAAILGNLLVEVKEK